MTRTTIKLLVPASIAILCIGISLLLSGCGGCPFVAGARRACRADVSEPGIYRVTYADSSGTEQTKEIAFSGMSGSAHVCIGDCVHLIGEPILISPLPPSNSAPDCSSARASVPILLNDGRMVEERIEGVTDPDGNSVGIQIGYLFQDITQDEPTNGLFEGDGCSDADMTSPSTARLRGEVSANGNGRVYRIGFTASDNAGGICHGQVSVCVPSVEGGTCVDDGFHWSSQSCPVESRVLRTPDLSLVISDSPDPVMAGDLLTYTLTVTNGNATANNVVLTDALSPGVTFIAVDSERCVESNGTVVCRFFSISTPVSVNITVRPTAGGLITNTASVKALESDPDPGNNTATVTTTVNSPNQTDLAVTVTDNPDPVIRGNAVTYTATVINEGPATATNVVLRNSLPPLEITSDILASQGSCIKPPRSSTITCDFGTLPSGASATLTVTGFTFTTGTITNTASATASEPDPNTANNSAAEVTTVNSAAAMILLAPWLDQGQFGPAGAPRVNSARFDLSLDISKTPWLPKLLWSCRHCFQSRSRRG